MSVSAASEPNAGIAFPRTVGEAADLLDAYPDAQLMGGGTWLMRAPVRGEALPGMLVSLDRIEGARAITRHDGGWTIGPMVTHAAIAAQFGGSIALAALAGAAGKSANPGVRRLATIGGNLATAEFPAADLVPALLALDASVTLARGDGSAALPIADFLARRPLARGSIVAGIEIPDSGKVSAHARLTMRRAGDYPVAIVSVAAGVTADRTLHDVRIAVGSVEATARRWRELETVLENGRLDPAASEAAARQQSDAFAPRDGVDVPGWYRTQVLPHLVRTALTDIESQARS